MTAGVAQRHGRRCGGGRCGCPWQASVYSKLDAKKIRKTFPTRAAALAWRNDAAAAVQRRAMRAPTPVTVGDAFSEWMQLARDGVIRTRSGEPFKPSAIRTYEQAYRLRLKPLMHFQRLADLSRRDLQDVVDWLIADGLSASTITVTMLPLRAIYRRAVARGDVAVNPTTGLQMPAIRGGRDRVASPAECANLLAALSEAERPLWATAMYAGLRRGELMALQLQDVNLDAGIIRVRRGWDALQGEIDTKSRQTRKVPIASALRGHLAAHLLRTGRRDGLMFGPDGRTPFRPGSVTRCADGAWRARDLQRITLHECRHTYASLMIAAGVNAKALSTYMGHANISITLDRYGHLMPGNEDEAAGMLDAYLARAEG